MKSNLRSFLWLTINLPFAFLIILEINKTLFRDTDYDVQALK